MWKWNCQRSLVITTAYTQLAVSITTHCKDLTRLHQNQGMINTTCDLDNPSRKLADIGRNELI